MMQRTADKIFRWRRSDGLSLEVLRLSSDEDGVHVRSGIVVASKTAFVVDYDWMLDAEWRTRRLLLRVNQTDATTLLIERAGPVTWCIDSVARPDLNGCEEIDLSITPFCNTLALRRFGKPGGPGELTTLYVTFPDLACVPSRQRYEQLGAASFKYIDLGSHAGFEAQIIVDSDGMVRSYQDLFERIEPT